MKIADIIFSQLDRKRYDHPINLLIIYL